MIRVENLTKSFGGLTVLKDVSIDISKGEVVSVIGTSGTGKSTFLRCLNLLETPDSGKIYINGTDIMSEASNLAEIRRNIGMVFQSFNLYEHLNVLDNITLGPVKLLKKNRRESESEAREYLRMVGLLDKAESFPYELSGGQKQRVAIARCLAVEPEIMLLDEPTSALDPTMVSEVLAVIRNLVRTGMTMLITTHEMEFARNVSSRVIYMDECGIYEDGPPEHIFENPVRPKTREFIYRIRNWNYQISTRDFDMYAMNGEIEHFCQKHLIDKRNANNIVLLIEELLGIYNSAHKSPSLEMSLEYSEKHRSLKLTLSYRGHERNILDSGDEMSLVIIKNLCDSIDHSYSDDKNHLALSIKKR